MNIVTANLYGRATFTEEIVAEGINEEFGKEIVKLLNRESWIKESELYYKLVDKDYVPKIGVKEAN